jgi:hypothetical protein
MSRAWRRAALESRLLSFSGRSPWRSRSAFSTHSVARTIVRFAACAGVALADSQARAAIAFGAATSSAASMAMAHRNEKRRGIPGSCRHARARA